MAILGIFDGEFRDGLLSVSHGFTTIHLLDFCGRCFQMFPAHANSILVSLASLALSLPRWQPALQPRMNIWKRLKTRSEIAENLLHIGEWYMNDIWMIYEWYMNDD